MLICFYPSMPLAPYLANPPVHPSAYLHGVYRYTTQEQFFFQLNSIHIYFVQQSKSTYAP